MSVCSCAGGPILFTALPLMRPQDPTTSKLSLLQTDDTTYDINFQKGDLTCKFRIDVHSLEAQVKISPLMPHAVFSVRVWCRGAFVQHGPPPSAPKRDGRWGAGGFLETGSVCARRACAERNESMKLW